MSERRTSRLAMVEELFSTHYAALFASGYALCKNRELTKDELQRFFLKLWENQERLPEMEFPLAYLRKAFIRQMLKALQLKRGDKTSTVLAAADHLVVPSHERILIEAQEQAQRRQALDRAIADLPAQQREVLHQRFQQGWSYEEIASRSGKSKQTVYNQIYEAIKKLKKSLLLSLVFLPFM